MKTFTRLAALSMTVVFLHGCAPRPAAAQTGDTLAAALRQRVKHVFVIYQENHTFDNYFGSYPGADNLASPPARTHGFRQYDPIGKRWVTPFRITDPDTSGPSQARAVIEAKMDGGKMDRFVAVQEATSARDYPSLADREANGLITMSFYDCDTLPYLWKYAKNFALFDHIFQGMSGPSTPGNIEVIAAQAGQTQWARFPADRTTTPKRPGDPIYGDMEPAFGPYEGNKTPRHRQIDQRYATLMLDLGGTQDERAYRDVRGVRKDLAAVAGTRRSAIPWGWYQEGYNGPDAPSSAGYESHHNAPQYFGYLRKNGIFWRNEHPLKQLLVQLRDGTLPDEGIFYIKGGSHNSFGWKPVDKDPVVQAHTLGDDDHPGVGDSDHEVGEAFVATFVNAIAHSKYWKNSAIIITWDDAGGYYDHVPPPQFERCSDGKPCGDGPRLPFLLISPFAKSGAVVHDVGDTASVVKFAETLFGLPALSSLPDEKPYMPEGPRDGNPAITNLLGAFDPARLDGTRAPIPASAAEIPERVVNAIPTPWNCKSIGVTPVHIPDSNTPPRGFRARPIHAHL